MLKHSSFPGDPIYSPTNVSLTSFGAHTHKQLPITKALRVEVVDHDEDDKPLGEIKTIGPFRRGIGK